MYEVTQELARGWMSLAGAMGGHTVVAKLLTLFGTEEQKRTYLPPMATGELRATMALTEPGGGSDLQNMTTTALPRRSGDLADQRRQDVDQQRAPFRTDRAAVQDRSATPRRGTRASRSCSSSTGRGLTVSRDLPKLGYKGVESCELSFDDFRVPASAILGGELGKGFSQMMKGLETGRIQVAARALGVATAALEDALAYAQQRESFGQPIWKHQADRQLPGRHGDQADRRPSAHPLRRRTLRQRRALRHGGRDGQAVRLRGRRWRSR